MIVGIRVNIDLLPNLKVRTLSVFSRRFLTIICTFFSVLRVCKILKYKNAHNSLKKKERIVKYRQENTNINVRIFKIFYHYHTEDIINTKSVLLNANFLSCCIGTFVKRRQPMRMWRPLKSS